MRCALKIVKLRVEWIPRELNLRAGLLSQIRDLDVWMLNPAVFAELDKAWDTHTMDRFASFHNCQLPRFNIHYWKPVSVEIDAFPINWSTKVLALKREFATSAWRCSTTAYTQG